jgi:ribosomal-protein-alanine N-acetyltransferase
MEIPARTTQAGEPQGAPPALRVRPRYLLSRDMPEVLAIERASFDYHWDEDGFLRELRRRNSLGYVAEHADRIVGFMIYRLLKDRLRLVDLAVHPEFRRRGVGRQLTGKLAERLSHHGKPRIVLLVRETNLTAQAFFRRRGYRALEVVREHYPDTGEAAYAMQYLPGDVVRPAWATPADGT